MSKVIRFLIIMFSGCFFVASLIFILNLKEEHLILDSQGNPSKTLLMLLDELNVKHDGNLKSIVNETQKEWLLAPEEGHCDVQEKYQDKKELLFKYFEKLGLINQVKPIFKTKLSVDRITVILDNLARYLYQEQQRLVQEQLVNVCLLDKGLRQSEQIGAFLK